MRKKGLERQAVMWDFTSKMFNPYLLPKGTILYTDDINLKTIVPCANCSVKREMGRFYNSIKIYSYNGKAHCVCYKCHNKEHKEKKEAESHCKIEN